MGQSKAEEESREAWYGVQDPRTRKQIQDRIAQRARRKRLARGGKTQGKSRLANLCSRPGTTSSPTAAAAVEQRSTSSPSPSDTAEPTGASATSSAHPRHPSSLPTGRDPGRLVLPWSTPATKALARAPLPSDQQFLVDPKTSLIGAFREIGLVMGILCGWDLVRSTRPGPSVPDILHPTPLQLTTPHYKWIDRWPFPRMRDNMILLAHTINLEEFFTDLFAMDSFRVRQGAAAWDPAAWQIIPEFREKWGFLFH